MTGQRTVTQGVNELAVEVGERLADVARSSDSRFDILQTKLDAALTVSSPTAYSRLLAQIQQATDIRQAQKSAASPTVAPLVDARSRGGMGKANGQWLGYYPHISQSISDILTTPKGSRVMRREYGSDVFELTDQPQNQSTFTRYFSAIAEAIDRWEPRVVLQRIKLVKSEGGKAAFELYWSLKGQADTSYQQVVTP